MAQGRLMIRDRILGNMDGVGNVLEKWLYYFFFFFYYERPNSLDIRNARLRDKFEKFICCWLVFYHSRDLDFDNVVFFMAY